MRPTYRTASSFSAIRFSRKLLLASVSLTLAGLTVSCEKTSSSEDVRKALDHGTSMIRGGESGEAIKILQGPANQNGAPGATLQLKANLGHAKYDQAMVKLAALDSLYLDVSRLQGEIAQLATSISVGNTLVEGYNKMEPGPTRDLLKTRLADVQGGPEKKVWVSPEGRESKQPIPTLSAAKQTVSELEQKLAAKQEEIRKLEGDRSSALQEADKLRDAVDGLKGNAQVDAFRKASEARKQVSLISNQIDLRNGELLLIQRDLEVAKGQVAVLEKYVEVVTQQDQAITSGQTEVQARVSHQQDVSKQAVALSGSSPGTAEGGYVPATLSAKSELLATKLDEAGKAYTEAEELLKGAQSAYEAAAAEAATYRNELAKSIDLYSGKSKYNEELLKANRQANWPAAYRIQVGSVLGRLGDLYARQSEVQSRQEKLVESTTSILQKAGAEVPGKLSAQAGVAKTAHDAAVDAYDKSVKELQDAADSIQQDPEKRKVAAATVQVFVLYQWAQLLRESGDNDGASKLLDRAREQRNLVTEASNGAFPATLPPELALSIPATGATSTPDAGSQTPADGSTPPAAAPGASPATPGKSEEWPATEPAK